MTEESAPNITHMQYDAMQTRLGLAPICRSRRSERDVPFSPGSCFDAHASPVARQPTHERQPTHQAASRYAAAVAHITTHAAAAPASC